MITVGKSNGAGFAHVHHFSDVHAFPVPADRSDREDINQQGIAALLEVTDTGFVVNGGIGIGPNGYSGIAACGGGMAETLQILPMFKTGITDLRSEVQPAGRYVYALGLQDLRSICH